MKISEWLPEVAGRDFKSFQVEFYRLMAISLTKGHKGLMMDDRKNLGKNRYIDIWPYHRSRVALMPRGPQDATATSDEPDDSYINACYIDVSLRNTPFLSLDLLDSVWVWKQQIDWCTGADSSYSV